VPDPERTGGAEHAGRFDLAPLVGILLIPAVLGSSKTIFNDGDVSWHIATGQWILDHGAIPHTDPFSYTWAGKPWVPIEWLAEVIYASVYRLAGYGGVAALVTAALMALHALVFFNANRGTRPLLTIVLMDLALIPTMLARPHLLAWPLLAGWTWLMLRAREKDRAPPLVAALLMTLWANLHGSFVIGLAVAGAFGLEAVIASSDRSRALRQWLIFGGACVAALFVNATGVEGVIHPLRIANLTMLPLIDEWKPSNPRVTPVFFAVLAVVALLIIWKRPRLHPLRWVLLGATLCAALLQTRHQAMLGIIAAIILPQGFAKRASHPLAGSSPIGPAVVGVGAVLLLAIRAALPMIPPDNEANPWKLIAAVPPQLRSQPVLNGYSMGGPLILSGIRPYVDGRGDMYGDELVIGYARITHGDPRAFAEAVHRWNIRWAILPHRNKELIALLDRSGWRRIASDQVGVIYVRTV
jgi:hypothetical protein